MTTNEEKDVIVEEVEKEEVEQQEVVNEVFKWKKAFVS